MDEARGFERNPDIMDGALCFAGTRIPVAAVKSFANAGYSPADIAKEYPSLTVADIQAGIEYGESTSA